ncbi:3752_t:CDS:2 [Entrophospora sp. SA101]|nr:3752_t:CDS:2 [Entrophospora sp. SA101]
MNKHVDKILEEGKLTLNYKSYYYIQTNFTLYKNATFHLAEVDKKSPKEYWGRLKHQMIYKAEKPCQQELILKHMLKKWPCVGPKKQVAETFLEEIDNPLKGRTKVVGETSSNFKKRIQSPTADDLKILVLPSLSNSSTIFENVDLEIPPDLYKWTQDLIHVATKHCRIEDHRSKALRERLLQKLACDGPLRHSQVDLYMVLQHCRSYKDPPIYQGGAYTIYSERYLKDQVVPVLVKKLDPYFPEGNIIMIKSAIIMEFSLYAACPSTAAKPKNFFKLQEKNPILNGRPLENTSSPIFFYHSVFGQFLNDFENVDLEIPPDLYK